MLVFLEDQGRTGGQGLGDLAPGRGENPLYGSPRHPHSLTGLFLKQAFVITELDDFELIPVQGDVLEFGN